MSVVSPSLNWREILALWGTPRPSEAPASVPEPLRAFWEAGGATALSNQNRFQAPEDDDGWTVFYVENQSCCWWAYRTQDQDADPQVYIGDRDHATYTAVGCRLDGFLTSAAFLEAVFGAPAGRAGECHPDRLDELLALERVELAHLGWVAIPTWHYRGSDVIAIADVVHPESAFAFIGARSEEALRDLDHRLSASPDWHPTS